MEGDSSLGKHMDMCIRVVLDGDGDGWRLPHPGLWDEWSTGGVLGAPSRLGRTCGQQLLSGPSSSSEPHLRGQPLHIVLATVPTPGSISTLSERVPIPLGPALGLKFRLSKRLMLWQQVM